MNDDPNAEMNTRHGARTRKKRAITFVASPIPLVTNSNMDDSQPLIDFSQYYSDDFEAEINSTNYNSVVDSDGNKLEPIFSEIVAQFNQKNLEDLITNPPNPISRLKSAIHRAISPEVFHQMIKFFPPIMPTNNPNAKPLIYFLLRVIKACNDPHKTVDWSTQIVLDPFYDVNLHQHPKEPREIKGICLSPFGKTGTQKSWVVLEKDNAFTFYNPNVNNTSLSLNAKGKCGSIQSSSKKLYIQVNDSSGKMIKKFTPVDDSEYDLWNELTTDHPPYFFLTFSQVERPIQSKIIPALYKELIADDTILLQALLKSTSQKDSFSLMENLFKVFSYAGKVNEFLIITVILEFRKSNLLPQTILRGNSPLTSLFRVFYEKFGIQYYNTSLRKVIKYIDQCGDLSLKNPINAPERRCYSIFFKVIKHILKSNYSVPPEMKHMASILKSIIAVRFNSKKCTYNALNNFFYLRFFNSILCVPSKMEKNIQLQNESVLSAFATILSNVFNLVPMKDKYEPFNGWNQRLYRQTFNDIVDFVFSIADLDVVPKYDPPSVDELRMSLEEIAVLLSRSFNATSSIAKAPTFPKKYNAAISHPKRRSINGWMFGAFLQRYFQENVAVREL